MLNQQKETFAILTFLQLSINVHPVGLHYIEKNTDSILERIAALSSNTTKIPSSFKHEILHVHVQSEHDMKYIVEVLI